MKQVFTVLIGRSCMLMAVVLFLRPARGSAQQLPAAETLQRWVAERRVAGIALGEVDHGHVTTAQAGVLRTGTALPVTDSTVFQIGSVTKAFTGLLLADMVRRGEVSLDDPVAKYLPGWTVPSYNGRQITLLDLATHRSGLPRLPTNMHPAHDDDPYADYGDDQLRDFLATYELTRAPGSQYEYSNLGFGLLGRVLALRARKSYELLLRERILEPLGMLDTRIVPDAGQLNRVAQGHDANFAPVTNWKFGALQSAGGLYSTVPDLLRLAKAMLDTAHGPLREDIRIAVRARARSAASDSIGLGWQHARNGDTDVVWHNGGTGGFRSWISVDIRAQRAVVALTNGSDVPIDAIGRALQIGVPVIAPPPVGALAAITLPASSLQRFVGRYEFTPQFALEVTLRHDSLFAQATGQESLPIFPSSDREFFYRAVKATLIFAIDSTGQVTGVTLQQNGNESRARRIP